MKHPDLAVIGGGIVGLSTAYNFQKKFPNKKVIVLEKENSLASHQTGHNSGVLHSGIYYKPGSLKAKNCRDGKLAMEFFCKENDIDYEICGKVIVAVDESERKSLHNIYERGQANKVDCELIPKERLKELEPHVQGVEAIHVPEAGIVNYKQVCERLAKNIQENGGTVMKGVCIIGMRKHPSFVVLETKESGTFESKYVVNCAGLHSDKVTEMNEPRKVRILPFRGEYFELKPNVTHLCKNLIYPVPDPKFPFLGVHFTRMIDNTIECGPNAVLALAREGYLKTDFNLKDMLEVVTYPGFWHMASKYWKIGMMEIWRSMNKQAFVRSLQRLIPEIQANDIIPAPAGIRAQAVTPEGKLVDDFFIQKNDSIINVCNAPSPAATASLNIGALITDKLNMGKSPS